MDFLEFKSHDLYFDEPLSEEYEALLKKAAVAYPSDETEKTLLDMHNNLPSNLTIIVALYRFYYYQHRYHDALEIAEKALNVSASKMDLDVGWQEVSEYHLGKGVFVSMGIIRFYMLCLKASAYVLMRIGEIEQAHARLKKITELDPSDQFGAAFLFSMAEKELSAKQAEKHNVKSLFRR